MKIPIKIARLTDSPYSTETKNSFVFDDQESIDQMALTLKHARPSSFLISGYRGVGKTSYVNRLREKLDKETLCVSVSVAKYDGYPMLVKKVIRQLYVEFKKVEETRNKDEAFGKLSEKFSLLYDRTFYNVVGLQKNSITKENTRSIEIAFNLKKLVPVISILLFGSNILFDFLGYLYISYILFVISIVWASVSSWDLKFAKSRISAGIDEVSRTTLYDDEIAEHHLFEILKDIKASKLSVLIVFDELDKIKATTTVEQIINDLKALLLSGFSNFFVVAGQGLYYQLEKAEAADDPMIASLFSKTIHIPFPKYSSLKKYAIALIEDQTIVQDPLFNAFTDFLILEARRVPRKLSNLFRARIVWEAEKAYIIVDESQTSLYESESKLLEITTKLLDNDLPQITSNVVKQDFFIAQVHLWIDRIKSYKSSRFTVAEITLQNGYDLNEYPSSYISQLIPLCELFLDRLVLDNILLKDSEAELGAIYSWFVASDKGQTNVETTEAGEDVDPNFLKEFAELENYVRGIYIDLVDGATVQNTLLSIKQMLDRLVETGALPGSWSKSNSLDRLIEVRNKVAHGISVDSNDLAIIQSSRFDIGRLKSELIEEYTFYVSKRFLKGFSVTKKNKGGFDFIANNKRVSIVFDVKYQQVGNLDNRNINDIINKFANYQQQVQSSCYYVLFYYQPGGRKPFDDFYSKFFDILNNRHPKLSNRFHIFYASEYRGDASTGRLEVYLGKVLDGVSKVPPTPLDTETTPNDLENASELIRRNAQSHWPDDYPMQVHEIQQQEEAVEKLKLGKPEDLSEEEFSKIRRRAKEAWPEDFPMRVHEEQQQIEALRKLRK